MKWISFRLPNGMVKAGWIHQDQYAIDMNELSKGALPSTILEFLQDQERYMELVEKWRDTPIETDGVYSLSEVTLMAPLPNPLSFRDFYSFEQHVKRSRERRGLEMIPEWYRFPAFYFSNHLAIKGPGEVILFPESSELDYELEIACVIGKKGSAISSDHASNYIFGFCIMNDWSARDLQREEMKVGLGPAKGKDFATSIGPYIVTLDEVNEMKNGHIELKMEAFVNGKQLSSGNTRDLYYSFGDMIERASAGVTLYPGEIIGSGTVGTGCLLELGREVHPWLKEGDEVSLTIEGLGTLTNKIGSGKG
ncbi:fumarylacetoacetate hydrolase family protein [Jeotgalibacillus sp. ET6]|uniref:fumarylacetoacetate hydrolase family protein n=1 Tax=Jeotgalibacillus sp. ET6 TaxID=3037260 RepID=UPI002418AB61|nr:fumarylacetoacetate hydrolase family protein [Jeotgalibacillus sp. ET6]MDG5473055.1 fumarylacetoacetate hydrolase family protein [Jeotgalibacillus sp. ET6]